MFKLKPTRTEPVWIDLLTDVRVLVKPLSVADFEMARVAAGEVYRRDAEAPDDAKDPHVATTAGIALTTAFAKRVILEWDGIGDESGRPVPVSAETVDAAMQVLPFFQAFDDKVFTPYLSVPIAEAAPPP